MSVGPGTGAEANMGVVISYQMMDRRRMKLEIRDRILFPAEETEPEVPWQAVAWEALGAESDRTGHCPGFWSTLQ